MGTTVAGYVQPGLANAKQGLLANDRTRLAAMAIGSVVAVATSAFVILARGVAQSGWPIATVFVAAALSAVAGFAFSAICGALLFHLLGAPVDIVKILLMCSIANQALSIFMLRRDIVWRRLWPLILATQCVTLLVLITATG